MYIYICIRTVNQWILVVLRVSHLIFCPYDSVQARVKWVSFQEVDNTLVIILTGLSNWDPPLITLDASADADFPSSFYQTRSQFQRLLKVQRNWLASDSQLDRSICTSWRGNRLSSFAGPFHAQDGWRVKSVRQVTCQPIKLPNSNRTPSSDRASVSGRYANGHHMFAMYSVWLCISKKNSLRGAPGTPGTATRRSWADMSGSASWIFCSTSCTAGSVRAPTTRRGVLLGKRSSWCRYPTYLRKYVYNTI